VHLEPYQLAKHLRTSSLIFALSTLLLVALLLLWNGRASLQELGSYHSKISHHSVNSSVSEITLLLESLRNALQMLVDENQTLILQLSNTPDDERLLEQLNTKLTDYFPRFHAFTLSDNHGEVLTDDLGEKVGDLCRNDIRLFATEQEHWVLIHPGPADYHFDIMVPWQHQGESGVFFVSFHTDLLSDVLKHNEVPGHTLYVLHQERSNLIELISSGTRKTLDGENFIDEQLAARVGHRGVIEGTRWEIIDLLSTDQMAADKEALWLKGARIFAGVTLFIIILMLISGREERLRARAEQMLRRSNHELEHRIAERTRELNNANTHLQQAIDDHERAEMMRESLQSVLKLIAINFPIDEVLTLLALKVQTTLFGAVCAIHRYDADSHTLLLEVAPNASDALIKSMGTISVSNDSFGPGLAAASGEHTVTENLMSPSCTARACHDASALGMHACHAIPINGYESGLLGTFSLLLPNDEPLDNVQLELLRIAADITSIALEQERITRHMSQLSSAVEQSADSIVITDTDGVIEYANPAFEATTGFSHRELIGNTNRLIRSGAHDDDFYAEIWNTLAAGRTYHGTIINRTKSGELYHEEKTISPLKDSEGNTTHYISTGRDITQRIEAEKRLDYLAHHDTLTGLPNRTLVYDRIEHAVAVSHRRNAPFAILYINLDRFKNINSSLGQVIGDELLKAVALRLKTSVSEGDTVSRSGGDEFVLLLDEIEQGDEARRTAERIVAELTQPFEILDHEIHTGATIGIAISPQDGDNPEKLLKNAHNAMSRAKRKGARNSYCFYTTEMSQRAQERHELESKLRHAIENNELFAVYQPKVNSASGDTIGFEVLLRWQNPELGLIMPVRFIPILEETGMIYQVGMWLIRDVARFISSGVVGTRRVAINISALQCQSSNLCDYIREVVEEFKIDPKQLEFEVTESLLIDDVEAATRFLNELHSMGCTISLDDFGTGYTSMSYLTQLPIDVVKIDRSFIQNIATDNTTRSVVNAIIRLAESLDMKVVAEGVEQEDQLAIVNQLGCNTIQGFLFSKPLPTDAIPEWLSDKQKLLNAK